MPDARPPLVFSLPGADDFRCLFVPGGAFDMGGADPDAYNDEKPVHRVTVPGFYLGEFPVTQDLWAAVMPEWPSPSYFRGRRRPVERVSWYDAAVFCNRLSVCLEFEPCYFTDEQYTHPFGKAGNSWQLPDEGGVFLRPGAQGFRLPSEAEWEFAARGNTSWLYAGSDHLKDTGWYEENSHGETKPVGMKAPNETGFYDLCGNVWEWCEDQWHGSYAEKERPDDGSAWVNGEPGAIRVRRGGSWLGTAQGCRAACRYYSLPEDRWDGLGFRLAFPLQADGSAVRAVR